MNEKLRNKIRSFFYELIIMDVLLYSFTKSKHNSKFKKFEIEIKFLQVYYFINQRNENLQLPY